MNAILRVDPLDPPEDLTLSLYWAARLNAAERKVYTTVAQVARGELPETTIRALSQHAGISQTSFVQAMYSLQGHGLFDGLPS